MYQLNRSVLETAGHAAIFGATRSPQEMLKSFTDFLRRQFPIILMFVVLSTGLGVAYILVTPPTFTAESTIVIDTHKVPIFQKQEQTTGSLIDSSMVDSEVEMLRSENVILAVVNRFHLADDPEFISTDIGLFQGLRARFFKLVGHDTAPKGEYERTRRAVAALRNRLTVKRIGLSYLIQISFESLSPERSAEIADAIANAYIMDQLQAKFQAARQAGGWLRDRLRELREQAGAADRAVVEFKAQHNIVSTGGRDKPLMHEQRVAELNSQLVIARAQVAEARARVDRVEAILRAGDTSDAMVDPTVADSLKNEVITKLRMEYFTLAQRADEWAKRYGSTHLAVVNLRGQMREIRNSIINELRRIAETYRSDSVIAQQRQTEIEHDLEQAVGQSQVADRAQVQLTELESNAQSYRTLYDDFLQRYTESVQAQSFPITEARIVTAAARPLTKSHPRISLVMLISASGGLILGLLLGHLRDLADRVFRTRDQLEQVLQLDCLATLPKIKASHPNTELVPARSIQGRAQQDRSALAILGAGALVREPASTAADVPSALPSPPPTVEKSETGAPQQEISAAAGMNAATALDIDASDVPAFDGPAAAEILSPFASFELGKDETPLSRPASDDRAAAAERGSSSPHSTDAASAPRLIARCRDPSWEVLNQPLSAYTEGIRSLKMALDLTRRRTARKNRKQKKIFGITSSSPSEGKSTIAASLAHLIAQSGNRVILVDCDLRATKLSRTFAPEAKTGLLEVLSGDASLEDVVWSDQSGKLHFLPAASITRISHTPEIIGAEEMRTLLERFRTDYEYAIIDLTPLLPVIDVRATEGLIDNYLFVVEWGRTKIDLVQRAMKEAPGICSKILGAILNKVDSRELRRYEGYGGYDYDKYYRR